MGTAHDTIDQAMVTDFDDALQHQASQKESRLQGTVTPKPDITGESFTHNYVGNTEMDRNTNRLGDTEWGSVDHKTPTANMHDFFKALPLDRTDIPRMKINPVAGGDYMRILIEAKNRQLDREIYRGLLDVQQFKDGSTEALPAGQIILHGGTGVTKGKLIQGRKIFRGNENDEYAGNELTILWNDAMLEDILADTTLTSADYMAVKMLQDGTVGGRWLGYNWIPYNEFDVDGTVATTVIYAKTALKYGQGYTEGSIDKRTDKKNAWQVSAACSIGTLRTEAVGVVKLEFNQ